MTERTQLFVYGTLMRDQHHHATMTGAEYQGPARTAPQYDLVQVDYYPALLSGGSCSIHGELFLVDEATLARLDLLEEVPTYYVRENIQLSDGRVVQSYLMPRERLGSHSPIDSGCFRTHAQSRLK